MFLALSMFTGFMVALMIQFNGMLQGNVGGTVALMSIHICGFAGAILFFLFSRNKMQADLRQRSPWYCLGAGMLGTVIVYLASAVFEKGGLLLSLSGSLAGQTLAASVAESFYADGRERSPLLQRILSPALLLPGSVIIGMKAGASPMWIMISWTPGIILMVQQSMNARNTARYGTPATVVFNYVSALILIVPLFLIGTGTAGSGAVSAGQSAVTTVAGLPWYVIAGGGLIGVFTTGSIAFLLLKAPALLVILGIYTGELAGGIILDLYTGNPLAVEKLIGIFLIAAGLGAGKIKTGTKEKMRKV